MNNKINKYKEIISKEMIEDLYIKKNLSKEEVQKELNLSRALLSGLIKFYDIKKSSLLIKEKQKETLLNKYGCVNPGQIPEVKEKIKNTHKEKYGKLYIATKEGQARVRKTKLEKYGSEYYNNLDASRLTKAVKYNNENYNNRDKYKKTMLDKYGVENSFQMQSSKDTIKDELLDRMNYCSTFKSMFNDRNKAIEYLKDKNLTYFDISTVLNIPYYTIVQWTIRLNLQEYINYKFDGKSHYEDEIVDYLESLGVKNIIRNSNKLLDNNLEIDIYLPDYKLGIEFNGNYWHSDLFKKQNYHQNKSIDAQKLGIHLIHIYQYEWDNEILKNNVKSILKICTNNVSNKLYARQCIIKEITNKEAKAFIEQNHIQGYRNAKITVGLFYNDKLVQVMSFSRNKKYQWEIIRSCSACDFNIVGGVSKLFTYFINKYNPIEIFSYCDFNKFTGISYEKLGMQFIGYTKPDLKYLIGDKVINRSPNKYKEIKNKVDARLYRAGSKKYLWERAIEI